MATEGDDALLRKRLRPRFLPGVSGRRPGDELFPGCLTSFAFAALRITARASLTARALRPGLCARRMRRFFGGIAGGQRSMRRGRMGLRLGATRPQRSCGSATYREGCSDQGGGSAVTEGSRRASALPVCLRAVGRFPGAGGFRRDRGIELPPTYTWKETEADETPYPGCLTSLGLRARALRLAPTCADLGSRLPCTHSVKTVGACFQSKCRRMRWAIWSGVKPKWRASSGAGAEVP